MIPGCPALANRGEVLVNEMMAHGCLEYGADWADKVLTDTTLDVLEVS
jgi:hypothetical protein